MWHGYGQRLCTKPSKHFFYKRLTTTLWKTTVNSPVFFSRFLDDIFVIWCGATQKLKGYENHLNNLIPGIKVTFSIKNTITEFLDTLVYNNMLEPGWCELCTRIFFKPTDTHQLLYGSSFHPRHCTRGILKSQILRFKRISTTEKDYIDACNELYAVLKD